jgi:hypothetical protein
VDSTKVIEPRLDVVAAVPAALNQQDAVEAIAGVEAEVEAEAIVAQPALDGIAQAEVVVEVGGGVVVQAEAEVAVETAPYPHHRHQPTILLLLWTLVVIIHPRYLLEVDIPDINIVIEDVNHGVAVAVVIGWVVVGEVELDPQVRIQGLLILTMIAIVAIMIAATETGHPPMTADAASTIAVRGHVVLHSRIITIMQARVVEPTSMIGLDTLPLVDHTLTSTAIEPSVLSL